MRYLSRLKKQRIRDLKKSDLLLLGKLTKEYEDPKRTNLSLWAR